MQVGLHLKYTWLVQDFICLPPRQSQPCWEKSTLYFLFFDFVGKVENFDNDLIRFQDMFGLDRTHIDKTNKFNSLSGLIDSHCNLCDERTNILKQSVDKERFYKTHKRDYELYNSLNR